MSHTTTRPRRFSRLAAGLTVAAAATATTLLGAAPAYAQTNAVTARMSAATLVVTGTAIGDRRHRDERQRRRHRLQHVGPSPPAGRLQASSVPRCIASA